MSKSTTQAAPQPKSGADRKRQYERRRQFETRADGSVRRTHVRMEFHVSVQDRARIEEIGVPRKELIPELLDAYERSFKLGDCGHRAWRQLAADILDLVGSSRPIDMALLHPLRRHVENALLEMKDAPD
ncbi:MAG: hypothetical protein QM750_23185 [Rubrivivax sp.]